MKPRTHEFKEGDLFWSEISVFVQAVTSRWRINKHAQVIRAMGGGNKLTIPGKHGGCSLVNPSRHEYTAQNGEFDTSCSFTEGGQWGWKPDASYLLNDPFLLLLQQVCFGHAFETAISRLRSKYGARKQWPSIFEVAYHLRNGAFHGNRLKIDNAVHLPANWRTLTMTKNLDGKPAFGNRDGVIGLGDIPIVLSEMRDALL